MEGSQGRAAASKADTGTMRCFGRAAVRAHHRPEQMLLLHSHSFC